MKPGTIFISHRSEYAELVKALKAVIQETAQGQINVFISEDIPKADDWRDELEKNLREAENLFLIYGAPYEDWSWCFYETGYFAAQPPCEGRERRIFCVKRKEVAVPSPLNHLQAVADEKELVRVIIDIYRQNKVDFNANELLERVKNIGRRLFGKIAELRGYSRVLVSINNDEFDQAAGVPADAIIESDTTTITQLFGLAASKVQWGEIIRNADSLTGNEKVFFEKWLAETAKVIRAGRENSVVAPQTVLIARRGGKRYRLLLYHMRRQGNDVSVFEFLAVDEVGGPSVRLPSPLLSILTAIRMGFRFRYELIDEFADLDWEGLSQGERLCRVGEFQTVLQNLLAESDARGNVDISEQNFYSAFDRVSAARMRKLIANWDPIHAELTSSLDILGNAKTSREVAAANIQRFRNSLEALRILNLEFLSRSCDCVAKMISVPTAESETNAVELDRLVKAMRERASGAQPEAPVEPNKLRDVA
jgi:TIR domain-containing protein